MGLIAAYIMPHPPLAIPGVGDDGDKDLIPLTMSSYDTIAREISKLAPDTIIVSSPHSTIYSDYFHISPGNGARGDFGQFLAPKVRFDLRYDREIAENLAKICLGADFPAGLEGQQDPTLDHGTMVPLYFVNKYYSDYKLVRLSLSGLSLKEHYEYGKLIKKVIDDSTKRIVYIASGDLSHYQKDYGPYGYRPEGPEYDKKLMETLESGDLRTLLDFDPVLLNRAGECGHRSFCIMAGLLDDEKINVRVLSHESTFGVGYGFCAVDIGDIQ